MHFFYISSIILLLILSFAGKAQETGPKLPLYAHRYNYVLPYSYINRGNNLRHESEFVYQLSFKIPVFTKYLYVAYTQRSLWAIYDQKYSRPFREHNYNPEAFTRFGGKSLYFDLGYAHHSNGKEDPDSRSWNHAFFTIRFNTKYFEGYLNSWFFVEEEQGDEDTDIGNGKAQSILDFYGNHELRLVLKMGQLYLGGTGRLNFDTNKGAVLADISYPLNNILNLYLNYFTGYGDSLIDYNQHVTRWGIGLLLLR